MRPTVLVFTRLFSSLAISGFTAMVTAWVMLGQSSRSAAVRTSGFLRRKGVSSGGCGAAINLCHRAQLSSTGTRQQQEAMTFSSPLVTAEEVSGRPLSPLCQKKKGTNALLIVCCREFLKKEAGPENATSSLSSNPLYTGGHKYLFWCCWPFACRKRRNMKI